MKRIAVFAVALLLTAGFAWAEETAAPTNAEAQLLAEEGGGCILPDTAGMTEDESLAALFGSGFEVKPTQNQAVMCPTTFSCASITNCAKGANCSLTNIGQCCQVSSGQLLCCINGPIRVERCPCRCNGIPCSTTCIHSTNVRLLC